MYIVREIFYLQFGRYKEAKVLIDEANQGGLLPQSKNKYLKADTNLGVKLLLNTTYLKRMIEKYKKIPS